VRVDDLKPDLVLTGPLFPERVRVIAVNRLGASVKLVGTGLQSGKTYQSVLSASQLERVTAAPETEPFDGDARRFRLGIEAIRLGLAYEYDPYFSLSIARVDPLPHQLEAVYDYFLRMPRVRFLLADDPGAGKTIMAGLLLKELKMRGLVRRVLIVAPANLCFQWQREMRDKFREGFTIIRGDVLRSSYGTNPWMERGNEQAITSVSWVSRVEDARESLLRSHWDLIVVDEAHKMSAYSSDHKTLAYRLGESLSEMTDHYLLMTATPHKGDPENFRLFLQLLDRDVYADVKSLEEAMRRNSAPFYLRRTKEALVTFPDPDTGEVHRLFTNRDVETIEFTIDDEEYDFYDALTRYVEDQSIQAAAEDSARGRALTFTMAMLQRRFASSLYAARRSLERMREKREKILTDPGKYRQEQLLKRVPDDLDDLDEEERQQVLDDLESVVPTVDPVALRDDIAKLTRLIDRARALESRPVEVESKLKKLKQTISEHGVFSDPRMKLLLFTEHKDTLDYLVSLLREWGLTVTQIHGGMKIGDRNTPGSRICAEREFRDDCQVMVATEAAGEGINLQFCWFMINYDIPWNPVRLEQRMGRIHRYGQKHDCLILNFASTNTREGRVLQKLLGRLAEIRKELGTDQVFDVVGEVLPANLLEKLFREMYARHTTEASITDRIVSDVDASRFRAITESTLEGLARRELNLSRLVGKSAEARERRLVPEVVEDFFVQAAPICGMAVQTLRPHLYRIGRIPRPILSIGEQQESRFGAMGKEYRQVVFDQSLLAAEATAEWVTPGHPLFEAARQSIVAGTEADLERGALFYDLQASEPYLLDVFGAAIKDGLGECLHQRLFVVRAGMDGPVDIKSPTLFLDLVPAPRGTHPPAERLPVPDTSEAFLFEHALDPFQEETAAERMRDTATVADHVEISLNAVIDRVQIQYNELETKIAEGLPEQGLEGRLKQTEDRLDELNHRLESRRRELQQQRECVVGDIRRLGRAWVLPHPERAEPTMAPMVQDAEIEQIAVQCAIAHEEAEGRQVESVESQNRGFDLISRRPHPEDPRTAIDVRLIEVKGRAGVAQVALTSNEYHTAQRLKGDYWLYVAFNCGSTPELYTIQEPARLGWQPVIAVEHYAVDAEQIRVQGAAA
jgi:superfamily II DNA or RNA helicase